jgi:hypothetical protein
MPPGDVHSEYANKHNLKAIMRYWARRQKWSPFGPRGGVLGVELRFSPSRCAAGLTRPDRNRTPVDSFAFRLNIQARCRSRLARWMHWPVDRRFVAVVPECVRAGSRNSGEAAPGTLFFRASAGLIHKEELQGCAAGCGQRYSIHDKRYDFEPLTWPICTTLARFLDDPHAIGRENEEEFSSP